MQPPELRKYKYVHFAIPFQIVLTKYFANGTTMLPRSTNCKVSVTKPLPPPRPWCWVTMSRRGGVRLGSGSCDSNAEWGHPRLLLSARRNYRQFWIWVGRSPKALWKRDNYRHFGCRQCHHRHTVDVGIVLRSIKTVCGTIIGLFWSNL